MIEVVKMKGEDEKFVLDCMREFYASDAVSTDGSEQIFRADVSECIGDSPYAEGYVFRSDGVYAGYGMLAKSYSTEFGKPVVWIEDVYVLKDFRGKGIASKFFAFVGEKYPHALLRLEVEPYNERAVKLYKALGFDLLPYVSMKK